MVGEGSDASDGSSIGLDHPEVRAWLARLETEAAVLPEERRTELRASVEDYLADATRDAGPDDHGAAERAVAELGSPAALVAEAGGYAVSPGRRARPSRTRPTHRPGPPWLEVATVGCSRHPWCWPWCPRPRRSRRCRGSSGTLLVLLSRRWGAGRQGAGRARLRRARGAVLLLGRDELPTSASLVVSVLLVAFWLAAAAGCWCAPARRASQGSGLRMR